VIGGKVGQNMIKDSASGNGESKRGDMIVDAAGFPDQAGEQVSSRARARQPDPAVTAAVKDVVSRLQAIKGVTEIESPLNKQDRVNTVSKDGRSVAVNFSIPGDEDHAKTLVDKPLAAVAAAQKANPDVRVEEFGMVSAGKAIEAQDAKDSKRSEMISYGITLLILLIAFGAMVAAGVPLLLGATAVAATIGLLGPVSQVFPLSDAVAQVVIVIGLAVGVDYAMFYCAAMMEERDKRPLARAALEIAAATSGRAVLISGFTVIAAMAGMLSRRQPDLLVLRRRHDARRRRRDARLDDVPARDARPSSAEGLAREGPRALRRQAPPQHKGESRVWARSSTASSSARWSRCPRRRPARRARVPALHMQFKDPASTATRAASRSSRPTTASQAAFPGGSVPASRGRQGQGRHDARGPVRDQAAP
jgi:RND superfamily putative drug exporter